MSEVVMVPDCNRNNNGGFGGNGNWMWIIFLFFLEPLMRNGWFGNNGYGNGGFGGNGYTNNLIDNTAGRELLNQAINRNGEAIQNLATMFNTSTANIEQAICGVQNSITQLGGQIGMSGQQTINAIQQNGMQLSSQLAECCCTIRTSILEGNYQNQIATLQQTQAISGDINNVRSALTQGFCDTAYSFRDQTCQLGAAIKDSTQILKDSNTAQTASIIAKLDAMENAAMQSKIDNLIEANSNLRTQINLEHQNALTAQAIANATAPLAAQLAEIKNAQPNTVTVPYFPFQVTPYGCNSNPYGNGCGCGSCQNQFWF